MLGAWAFLFLVMAFVSQLAQSHEITTRFSFPSFGSNNSDQLIYMGNASFSPSHGYIDLTPSPNGRSTDQYFQFQNCIGRVLYRHPIAIWPATFTTTFTMLVSHIASPDTHNWNGDGLAFIIVPNDKPFQPESVGAYMGLFDGSINQNTTNQLAIEFDTFKNMFDPDDNHVGIDIKSIISDVTANMGKHSISIKSGRPIRFRINYNGWNKNLQIYASYADQSTPYASILNLTIELSRIVLQSAYLGFSAATGTSYEIHRILDWNFSSVNLPESSLNIAPVSSPRSAKGSKSTGLKVSLLLVSIAVGIVLLGLSAWFVSRAMNGRRGAAQIPGRGLSRELAMIEDRLAASPYAPRRFSYKMLSEVTKNFSETELLGSGGFGSVYKGTLEGRDGAAAFVVVKRVSARSRQGKKEFISEIGTIGRLRHRNLVRLQGWCHEHDELLLVYDYMPNMSLDKFIFRQSGD